jgi:DNA-directed RNA polymerase specialized sigma24 family protein
LKKSSLQTPEAFRRFLSWLDEGVDSGGGKYLEMRRRLVSYFARKRCLSPDELADETLNRVARRLEEQQVITGVQPARYCYIVAKFVFLEHLRGTEHNQASLDGVKASSHSASDLAAPSGPNADDEDRERRLDCLDRCLRQLDADDRQLILEYYRGEQRAKIEHRRRLAARLDVTANALSIRACRIRHRLEGCVSACSGRKGHVSPNLSYQE